jgi:uncharacterized protein YcfL
MRKTRAQMLSLVKRPQQQLLTVLYRLFFYVYDVRMDKLKLMVMSSLLAGCLISRTNFSRLIEHTIGFHV